MPFIYAPVIVCLEAKYEGCLYMKMIIELFCGTKVISDTFKQKGYKVFTLDNDKRHNPDLIKNILDFEVSDLPKEFQKPYVVWASPPCTSFSMASVYRYWDTRGKPSSYKTYIGLAIVKKTIEIIEELQPKYWFIENPRAMLRQQDFMLRLHRKSVTYCQYGSEYQKPTDIWTNAFHWIPKKMCLPGDKCHKSAKRGQDTGIQALKDPVIKAIIPKELALEIYRVCENRQKLTQKLLL